MTTCAKAAITCALLSMLATSDTLAGVNQWTIDGPYGGRVPSILYVPGQDGVALAGAGNTIYRTTDNGRTWAPVMEGLVNTVTKFTADPGNPRLIIGIGPARGPVRSEDGGLTFHNTTRFGEMDGGESAFAISGDGHIWYGGTPTGKVYQSVTQGVKWEDRSAGLPQSGIMKLVVDQQLSNHVYAITSNGNDAAAFVTSDGGLHWSALNGIDCAAVLCHEIAIDPQNTSQLLLATGLGVYRSTDAGLHWSLQISGHFFIVRFDPTGSSRVLAASTLGVFSSNNAGQSWTTRAPHRASLVHDLAFDPALPGRVMLGTSDGVLQSENAADSWQTRSTGIRAAEINNLTAASDGTNRIFASSYVGPLGAFARDPATARWISLGRSSMQSFFPYLFNVAVVRNDPASSGTLYATANSAVLKSVDAGATWAKPSSEFDFDFVNDLVIDPLDSQLVYAATSARGFFRSSDGGSTWSQRSTGLTPTSLKVLAMDPQNSQVIYAGSGFPTSLGVHKTVDGGLHWIAVNSGIETASITKIAIDSTNSQTVYAGTPVGLFKTVNGGANWIELPTPGFVTDVVVDPVISTNVIRTPNPSGWGVARSVDGGQTWETVDFENGSATTLVLDPAKPTNLLAGVAFGIGEIEFAPDLKVSSASQFVVDASQSITAAITNRGPYAASGVLLTINGITASTIALPTTNQGSCVRAETAFVCSLGALRVNDSASVTVANVRTTVPGEALDLGVRAHERDPNPSNNSLTLRSEVITDVAASLSASATTAIEGSQLNYTLRISNAGPSYANTVRVSIEFPPTIEFGQFTTPNSRCAGSSPILQCDIGSLGAGATLEVSFTAVAASVGQGGVIATATTISPDKVASNNFSSAIVTVIAKPAVGTAKSGGGGGAISWVLALLLSFLALSRTCRITWHVRSVFGNP